MTDSLYAALVRLCQAHGVTNEATYEALHAAVDSMAEDICAVCPVPLTTEVAEGDCDEWFRHGHADCAHCEAGQTQEHQPER